MKKETTKCYYPELDSQLKSVKKKYTFKGCINTAKKRGKNPFFVIIDFFESAKLYSFDEYKYNMQKQIIESFYKENKKTNEELILRKYFLEKQYNTKYAVTLPIILSLIASFIYSLLNSLKDNQIKIILNQLIEFFNIVKENSNYVQQYPEISSIVTWTLVQFFLFLVILLILFIVFAVLTFRLLPVFIEGFKLNKHFILKFEIDYISKLIEENNKELQKSKDEYIKLSNELSQIRNQLSKIQEELNKKKR